MGKWEMSTVGAINRFVGKIVNPANKPDDFFELYSVPSWDCQVPEIIQGKQIGSSKISVDEGDVLICKINPRINRVWVVQQQKNYQMIASSEWIVIRNNNIDSEFLLRYFTSPKFRDLLISEQSGIGGSLTRAQPKQVQKYPVPLPPLPVQHKIADVLARTSVLIEKRKAQIAKLDLLVKSQFIEMFGDLNINDMGWKTEPFSVFARIDAVMTTDYEKYADYPHIGIDSIESGTGELKGYRTVKQDGVKSGKYIFTQDHIIYSKIRPNLNKVAIPAFDGLCSADAYPILNNGANCSKVFLAYVMRSDLFLLYVLPLSYRTNFPKVNREQIAGFSMPLPPLPLQNRFADFVRQVDKSKFEMQQGLDKLELLYKSLMQKCFVGEMF